MKETDDKNVLNVCIRTKRMGCGILPLPVEC
jgi:hypothetical protein